MLKSISVSLIWKVRQELIPDTEKHDTQIAHIELCFWLFLLNSGSTQHDWFKTWYFRAWVIGSGTAVLCLPLLTILTRSDLLKCEAYLFLAGSLGSLCLTLWFLPILWMFPAFLENLKSEGVETGTIVRLTKFSELNQLRIVLRLLFVVPFFILGIDGVRPHHDLNESMVVTDVLAMIAGFGCVVSSGITLVIFFPRSIEGEIAERDASRSRKKTPLWRKDNRDDTREFSRSDTSHDFSAARSYTPSIRGTYLLTSSPVKAKSDHNQKSFLDQVEEDRTSNDDSPATVDKVVADETNDVPSKSERLPPLRPNRRKGRDVELGGIDLTENNLSRHNLRYSSVNPMIQNYKSPIEFAYTTNRLTFQRS
ncbi:hypothetical protein AX17_004447 [Amanita inopinata Kibby_2008]|nr:hypothetical protein AX17_004447 [Amanita inopinata Kibby_2008]